MRRSATFAMVWLGAMLWAGPLPAAISFVFDYTYDSAQFFGTDETPQHRDLLELAGAALNRFVDDLEAIVPGGQNTLHLGFYRPDTGQPTFLANPVIPADTILVYVGARDMGPRRLAETNTFEYQTAGTPQWKATVDYRGEDPADDYGPIGGTLTFADHPELSWHLGVTSEGLDETNYDFLSVAMHELGHLLGFGPATSWQNLVEDGKFTGPHASAVGSSNNPDLELDSSEAHWAEDTLSTVAGTPQVAAMEPYFGFGQRKRWTLLDDAALEDIGWEMAFPGDVDRDGDFDVFDVLQINSAAKYGPPGVDTGATWAVGDNDHDGDFDVFDVLIINSANMYGPPGAPMYAASVPEPATLLLLAAGAVTLLSWRRRR